jgi:hypothetical protein
VGIGDLVEGEGPRDRRVEGAGGEALADELLERRELRVSRVSAVSARPRTVRSRAKISKGGTTVGRASSAP